MSSCIEIPAINSRLKGFVKSLSLSVGFDLEKNYTTLNPVEVSVQATPIYRQLRCWFNAYDYSLNNSCDIVFGWAFWLSRSRGLLAQHHAICRQGDTLIDISPNELNSSHILFAEDDRATFNYDTLSAPYSYQRLPNGICLWTDGVRRLDRFGYSKVVIDNSDLAYFKRINNLQRFIPVE